MAGGMEIRTGAQLRARFWLLVGLALVVIGVAVAALVERSGGTSVSDVRFRGADGTTFSALVYRPANATPEHPAPGILAVHGYINTRETQSPFAIEFARRGYVVVALDQRGHGYSGGAATAKGFGGPEGLTYLRSLDYVDKANIGLEGHSMGGWTVLAAGAVMPEAYKAMVLEGSSTGKPFAKSGTPDWPRNVAVVYSQFDEFAPLMWQAPQAGAIGQTAKLKALFGTTDPVVTGKTYGDIASGTARRLTQPFATHPGDHLSTAAVADAADWFGQTLKGGTPRARGDQVWWGKEIATGIALLGIGALMLGLFDFLLGLPSFAALRHAPEVEKRVRRGRWWTLWLLTAFVPALTFYLLPGLSFLKPSALLPQGITNTLMIWAAVNILLALLFGWLLKGKPASGPTHWGASILMAVIVVGVLYGVTALAGLVQVDFRFWVVALKPLSASQAIATLSYVIPFTLFVLVAFRGLTALASGTSRGHYGWAAGALATGFFVLTGVQYLILFATGALPVPFEALNAIVAIQFVPLLLGLGVLAVYTWRRTGSYVPGSLIGGLFITWYMVAGTATHFA